MNTFAYFNVVKGAIDAMHGVYGGVMKMLLSLWFNTKLMKGSWYIGNRLHEVDEWLLMISPPSGVSKGIRSLKERNYWKGIIYIHIYYFGCEIRNVFFIASEYQYFLMFYGLPCLLPLCSYYNHFKKIGSLLSIK